MTRAWAAQRSARAPVALRDRMLAAIDSQASSAGPAPDAVCHEAALLAAAARRLLEPVLATGGDRRVAIDLLAADGLLTLALLCCAEREPARLAEFARQLTTPAPR